MNSRDLANNNLILLSGVGSEAHGLNVPGQDDHDEMGICIEPPEYVMGLRTFEQDVFRTKPEGMRSEAGDIDRTIYSLRKWCRLALHGNPTILLLLYATPTKETPLGKELRQNAHWFASKEAGKRYLGYLTSQKQRLLGERGQMRVKRPELWEAHGYDTKYAMHILRLGFQGVEFLETGALTLPLPSDIKEYVYNVRTGGVDLNEVLTKAGELEQELKDLIDGGSPLPDKPDYDSVNRYLVEAHLEWWYGKE